MKENCVANEICAQQSADFSYQIDYHNNTSLHNWVETLDLVCVDGAKLGMIGASYFVGWTATCLVVPPMADKYGRKWVVRTCLIT